MTTGLEPLCDWCNDPIKTKLLIKNHRKHHYHMPCYQTMRKWRPYIEKKYLRNI